MYVCVDCEHIRGNWKVPSLNSTFKKNLRLKAEIELSSCSPLTSLDVNKRCLQISIRGS